MQPVQQTKNDIKLGQLFLTTSTWDAFHMMKNPHGIWVPKQGEPRYLIHPNSMLIRSTLPPETPAMYIGTDGRPHFGVFLVADTFCELPYNILIPIEEYNESKG